MSNVNRKTVVAICLKTRKVLMRFSTMQTAYFILQKATVFLFLLMTTIAKNRPGTSLTSSINISPCLPPQGRAASLVGNHSFKAWLLTVSSKLKRESCFENPLLLPRFETYGELNEKIKIVTTFWTITFFGE